MVRIHYSPPMDKKDADQKVIDARKRRKGLSESKMKKMPKIINGPSGPGRVGHEKPKSITLPRFPVPLPPLRPIRPLAPPPSERAIQPEQKQEVIQALFNAWLEFPYLRLGQLVSLTSFSSVFKIEDGVLKEALLNFKHDHIRCGSWNHSRTSQCTLEHGHDGDRHYSQLTNIFWNRF